MAGRQATLHAASLHPSENTAPGRSARASGHVFLLTSVDLLDVLQASDPTLYCVSAWNPMGSCHQHPLQQQDHNHHNRCSSRLLRSDVNPGRGWLLGRATGLQLLNAWSQGQQLDWQQHIHSMGTQYGRQCIVPEAPRMLPAAVHDTAAGAHIVTAAGDVNVAGSAVDNEAAGAVRLPEHSAVQQPASGKDTGAGKHQAAALTTGVADGGEGLDQDGVVDHDAESAPAVAWQPAADGNDTPAALAAAGQQAAAQGQFPRSSWLGRDVSHMLAQPYRRRLHKVRAGQRVAVYCGRLMPCADHMRPTLLRGAACLIEPAGGSRLWGLEGVCGGPKQLLPSISLQLASTAYCSVLLLR